MIEQADKDRSFIVMKREWYEKKLKIIIDEMYEEIEDNIKEKTVVERASRGY